MSSALTDLLQSLTIIGVAIGLISHIILSHGNHD